MSFVYPSFLLALLALAIPIIIHLFSFRRYKKVYFTNVKFLKEVKEQKANRTRLKHLLVLLSRLLTLAFLVFAFAQPYIKKDETEMIKGDKGVSIYIDNSQSMAATSNDVSLLEKAKLKAREIAEAYAPNDRFQLMTNDLEGKHQRMLNREEFLTYLDEIQISPNVQTLSSVTDRQKQALSEAGTQQENIFIISDFQKSIVDLETDTAYQYHFIPLESVEQQNVFVDSIWFETPVQALNQTTKLFFRTRNTGLADVTNSRIKLLINNETKALDDFSLKAQSSKIDTINFSVNEAGWHQAELQLTDYPITHDDSYYFTFKIDNQLDVLTINQQGNNQFLNALFAESNLMKQTNQSVSKLNYAGLGNYRLIVLSDVKSISTGLASELKQYLEKGGNVVIFPPIGMDGDSYNSFLRGVRANTYGALSSNERAGSYINVQQEVFADVFERIPRNLDLPTAQQSYEMTRFSGSGEETLLRFRDGGSLMGKYQVGQGKLYLCAAPLDNKISGLPSHAIFVPMIYKMALVGGDTRPLAYTIGADNLVEVGGITELAAESVIKIQGDEQEFIPGQKMIGTNALLNINNQLKKAGFYKAFRDASLPLAFLGFNFDRAESIMDYFSIDELKSQFSASNINIMDKPDVPFTTDLAKGGTPLWKWCLMAALAFLLIEILLLRLWKNK